jgi:hypothetical protein
MTAKVKVMKDSKYPGMFRVRYPDGTLSDMVNISRAHDALNFYERNKYHIAARPV